MNKETSNLCALIKDTIPLYEEEFLSKGSKEIIENHLKNCETCRKNFETAAKETINAEEVLDYQTVPLKVIQSRINKKRLGTQLAILFVILLFTIVAFAYAYFAKPTFLNEYDCNLSIEQSSDGNIIAHCQNKDIYFLQRVHAVDEKTVVELIPWTSKIAEITSDTESSTILISDKKAVDAVYLHERSTGRLHLLYGKPLEDVKKISDISSKDNLSRKYAYIPLAALLILIAGMILLRNYSIGKIFLYAVSLPIGWLISLFFVNGIGFESSVFEKNFAMLSVALDAGYCIGIILLCIFFIDLISQDFMSHD